MVSLSSMVSLYVRFSNGRVIHCYVDPETCLDSAITMVCSGALYVGLDLCRALAGPWQFQRNVKRLAAAPRPIRKAVVR